jgi:hypothetical protein
MRNLWVLLAALCAAASGGCSGSSSSVSAGSDAGGDATSSGGEGGAPGSAQACNVIATARCNKIQSCASATITADFGGMAACLTNYSTDCLNSLAASSTGNSAAITQGCAEAIANWDCSDYENGANTPAACVQVKGTLASGTMCSFAGQCQSGFCAIDVDARCGVCADPPTAGSDCSSLSTCGQGLTCTRDTNTCVVPAAVNTPCGKGAPCGYELSCVGATATAMGMCQTSGTTAGATCDPKLATAAGCAEALGFYCNGTTKQCEMVSFASGGQSCGTLDGADGGRVDCSGAARCIASETGDGGTGPSTCVAPASEGSACLTTNTGPGCLGPDHCVTGDGGAGSGSCEQTNSMCP